MVNLLKSFYNTAKYWYLLLIVGIIFILTALYTFTQPVSAYLTLSVIFAFSFLFSGISETVFALSNRKQIDNPGWVLTFGILNIVVGFMLLSNIAVSMVALPLYVGFVLLFRSISEVSISFSLKNYNIENWGFLLAMGILGIIFSLLMIFNPAFGGINIAIWTGLAFLLSGSFMIYFSLQLRKLKKFPAKFKHKWNEFKEDIREEIEEGIEDMRNSKGNYRDDD